MKKVYIMIGCPGSGKSTWVEEQGLEYVSRDQVRSQLGYCSPGEKYLGNIQEEAEVTEECNRQRKEMYKKGIDFAIDDTNVRKFRREILIKELKEHKYIAVGIKMKTPLSECLRRRRNEIPEGAIINMWKFSQEVDPSEFDEFFEI